MASTTASKSDTRCFTSAPVPSATDRARATWLGYVYLIVSPPDALRAYRYVDDGFVELPIQVESRE